MSHSDHQKCIKLFSDKFQENLSRPGIIDARARYRAAARRLRNTALDCTLRQMSYPSNYKLNLPRSSTLCVLLHQLPQNPVIKMIHKFFNVQVFPPQKQENNLYLTNVHFTLRPFYPQE